jgi:hypothetical protein
MENIKPPLELHVCMGLNSCQNQGYSGQNACAGMGDCSVVSHPCHTVNECKGQGGCGLFGTTEEFCYPSQNDCRYQGSCGAPILDSRFVTQGPNRGNSVWQLARKRFEEKRAATGQPVGPPPAGPYGPSNAYINQLKGQPANYDNASCGQSGARDCSYAADPITRATEARARVLEMAEASARNMPDTLKHCSRIEK